MRICVPIHSFEPGGVERVGLRLAERWQAEGHEVTVVLGRDRGPTRGQAPALRYMTRPEPFSTAAWETPWLIWCLWRYLRQHPADVIFCAGNTYTIVCVAMKLLLGRRCPPVLVKISNDLVRPDFPAPVQALYRVWLRIQGKLLDRFVAIALPLEQELPGALGVAPGRVVSIANPVLGDGELTLARDKQRRQGGGRHFLAVGRLEPQKNYPLMIEAFARLAGPADRLTIAGAGSERAAIEAAIERAGLDGRAVLLGHVAEPGALFAAADALVLSSDYEGLPGAVVEALASGLPIAATDCCASMNWLLGDGAFGVLAARRDSGSLAAAMTSAAALEPDTEQMRRRADLFTIAKAAPRYLEQFEALAFGQASGRSTPSNAAEQGDRIAPC